MDIKDKKYQDSVLFRPYLRHKNKEHIAKFERQVFKRIEAYVNTQKQRIHKNSLMNALSMILANLFSARHVHLAKYLAISRNKNTYDSADRYSDYDYGYASVCLILDALEATGILSEQVKGDYDEEEDKGYLTRVSPSPSFSKELLKAYGSSIDLEEVGQELILLRSSKDTKGNYELINYSDNDNTRMMRENLTVINNALRKTVINIHLPDSELKNLNQRLKEDSDRKPIDFSRCNLVRIFNRNDDFSLGGRFYRGWWQEIPKKYRKYIEINNQMTVEFDYSSLHAVLIYLKFELTPVENPYVIEGYEDIKGVVKLSFQFMLNAKNKYAAKGAIDKHWEKLQEEEPELNQRAFDSSDLMERIEERHHEISSCFYSGMGLELQRTDSDIAEQVMLEMLDDGFIVLPIHDSFIVDVYERENLKRTMMSVTEKMVGYPLTVDKKDDEMEEINDKREAEGNHPWSIDGAAFITRGEKGLEEEYKQYFKVRDSYPYP